MLGVACSCKRIGGSLGACRASVCAENHTCSVVAHPHVSGRSVARSLARVLLRRLGHAYAVARVLVVDRDNISSARWVLRLA